MLFRFEEEYKEAGMSKKKFDQRWYPRFGQFGSELCRASPNEQRVSFLAVGPGLPFPRDPLARSRGNGTSIRKNEAEGCSMVPGPGLPESFDRFVDGLPQLLEPFLHGVFQVSPI
jgi:hypothetical protein